MKRLGAAAIAALLFGPVSVSHAGTFTIPAKDSGWHSSAGNHTASNQNYVVGWDGNVELRNFFVFDLSGLPAGQAVISATLRAYNPDVGEPDPTSVGGYDSQDATETWQLREVLFPAATVTASTASNPAVYNDLGDGSIFGTRVVSPADNGTFIEISLNAAGIAAVDAATGDFVLGGGITTLAMSFAAAELVFAGSAPAALGPYPRELVVVTGDVTTDDCGNGVKDPGEDCDEGAGNGTTASCCSDSCLYVAAGQGCDDEDACTTRDECNGAGVCAGLDPVVCPSPDECHLEGTCDPATGLCDDPEAADGTACEDGAYCSVGDTCQGGVCAPGFPRDCSGAGDQCSDGICDEDARACVAVPQIADSDGDGIPDCLDIEIDVKPGSPINPVNLMSKGVVPVAILSGTNYNALVDRPFVGCFGRTPAEGPGAPCDSTEEHGKEHLADVDGDGDIDTLLHYDVRESGIEAGDSVVCLEGTVGTPPRAVKGCDRVLTLGR